MTANAPEDARETSDRLDDLETQIEELRAALSDRDARLEALESRLRTIETAKDAPPADRFDGPVLAELDPGETVTSAKLRTLYQTRTPIQQESTARDRLKSLTKRPEFEFIKPGRWVYDPEVSDE